MAYEIEIVGDQRWDEIVACEDEVQRWRLVRKYIFDLKQENKQLKDDLAVLKTNQKQFDKLLQLLFAQDYVQDYVHEKVNEATENLTKDWSGVWG